MTTGISHELAREYISACLSRDPQRLSRCIHDQVTWTLTGPIDLMPFCGQRLGKQNVIDTIVRLVPTLIRLTGMEVEEILADGDRAATFLRLTAVHVVTGRTVSFRSAQFLRFRDNKLIEFRAVIDSFDAAEQVLGHAIGASLSGAPQDFASSGNRIAI
jgi:ketosteroid isomerase-like protein